ncbi:MAG TPA: gluconate 2-dehydrogenase subunit 3 family protein [Terracidiphilus sp.]|nr:gluconate 2-dehydrogenase subunit 3 family protein [Terracidiphilus sp.]
MEELSRDQITRRAVLKSLSVGAVAGSVLRVIPLEAAELAHSLIDGERTESGSYVPKFFNAHQYKTVQVLCETIIPADADGGGAIEGGAPEFIDLLTSENSEYQTRLAPGLAWLDSTCTSRFGKAFVDCSPQQQTQILDSIAFRKSAEEDESLEEPVEFFSFLRSFTADGYFTSKIGIKYLGYKGNTYLTDFPGCPPVPGL